MQVARLPAFEDNYLWVVHDHHLAWAVDPGDSAVVQDFLVRHSLTLQGILLTHHHRDHTGGVRALVEQWPDVAVLGSQQTLCGVSQPVKEGQRIQVIDREFEVLAVPGHTLDHVAYFSGGPTPWLFCGDTLFVGGCGRMFEGEPAMFARSLNKLAALPDDTAVFCAHEYSEANYRFAQSVLDDPATQRRAAEIYALRSAHQPTVPGTLGTEKAANPFLRFREPALKHALGLPPDCTDADAFGALRRAKDVFKT